MNIGLDEKYMRLAIEEAYKNFTLKEGGPFGACIVKDNQILGLGRNKVITTDASSHAEVNAIREASKKINSFDLSGSIIYSTTEPCPMCFSALHWARVEAIVYGTGIGDAKEVGFNELSISNQELKNLGKAKVKLYPGFLLKECRQLFKDWKDKGLDKEILY